jgi:hypothetical protein
LPIAVCGVMGILTLPLLKTRGAGPWVEDCLGLMTHGMLALLFVAAPMALEDTALTAAWAALLPVVAWALLGLRLPSLTIGLVALFLVAAFRGVVFPLTFARESVLPGILVWNPIVWTYGSLLLATVLALVAIPRFRPFWKEEFTALPSLSNLVVMFQTAAMAAAFLLLTFSIRWGAREGAMTAQAMPLMERATYPIGWLVLAAALVGVAVRFKSAAASAGAQASTWMALLWVFCINTLLFSPLFTRDEIVGSVVFNSMLYLYGIPMLVFAGIGWRLETGKHDMLETLKVSSGIVALVLLFALVTLDVRFLFHGPMLSGEAVTTQEMTAYSMAWAILGGVLLLGGIVTRSITLRWASLVIMFLTVVKVFIFDLAGLKDLLRVLSFAGLGVSLMLLAFIYQRFVFRTMREEEPAPAV